MAKQLNTVVAAGVFAVIPSHDNYIIKCNTGAGAVTLNLPSIATLPANFERIYVIDDNNNAGTNNITINAFAGQFIDGAASITLSTNGSGAVIQSLDDDKWIGGQSPSSSTGLTSLLTTNITWVLKNGNDGTGLINRLDLPFLTIGAAITASPAGHTVWVGPGIFDEKITLKNGVNLHFEDSELRDTAVGAGYIFRDNGVAVTCDITGSAKLLTVLKQGILLTAASIIKAELYSMVDTAAGGNYISVGVGAKLVLTLKSANLPNGPGIFGGVQNQGIFKLICPDFIGSVANVGAAALSEVIGNTASIGAANGKLTNHGDTGGITATLGGTVVQFGDVNTFNLAGTYCVDVNDGIVRMHGNINSTNAATPVRVRGASGVLDGIGRIHANNSICVEMGEGRFDWDGNINHPNGTGIFSAALLTAIIVNYEGVMTGNGRSIDYQNTNALSEMNIRGSSLITSDLNRCVNYTSLGKLRISNTYLKPGAGIECINIASDGMILDNVTLVTDGVVDSIEAAAAQTVAIYSQCNATTLTDVNVTLTVNPGGYLVNTLVI